MAQSQEAPGSTAFHSSCSSSRVSLLLLASSGKEKLMFLLKAISSLFFCKFPLCCIISAVKRNLK